MKRALVVLCVYCFAAVFAMAQEHPAVTAQPNTVYVGADGKFEAAPDTALVQFNISAQEDTAKAAYDRASRATDHFQARLAEDLAAPGRLVIRQRPHGSPARYSSN